jgi:hypothetical protein
VYSSGVNVQKAGAFSRKNRQSHGVGQFDFDLHSIFVVEEIVGVGELSADRTL